MTYCNGYCPHCNSQEIDEQSKVINIQRVTRWKDGKPDDWNESIILYETEEVMTPRYHCDSCSKEFERPIFRYERSEP